MTSDNGAIPLPTGEVRILFNPSEINESTPQPEAQQLASFDAISNDDCPNGKILDVNHQFVVYAVKNGLIRVLHRQSTLKALLRGHEGTKVTDIQYFNQGDVLGTVGGNVIIWRIFERSPEIVAEKLMEIPATLPNITRLKWHPFNPNQFWLFHHNSQGMTVATLVESTRMSTTKHATEDHAVCVLHSKYAVLEGAIQLAGGANVTDLDWSGGDARHVMTTHDDGAIRLWDIKTPAATNSDGTVVATCMVTILDQLPVTRGFFLPHQNIISACEESCSAFTTCFCTATKGNSEITVWSPFQESEQPKKLQVFGISEKDAAYNLAFVTPPAHVHTPDADEPPAFFFMLSDRNNGKIFALHLKSVWNDSIPKCPIAVGFDYIVPFKSKFATYSWVIAGRPADRCSDDEDFDGAVSFDILISALQTKAVQHMIVPYYMCLPPHTKWEEGNFGVTSEPLVPVSEINGEIVYEEYDEDFDPDDEVEETGDYEEYSAPEASSLPVPQGMRIPGSIPGPFDNWLGAMAANTGLAGLHPIRAAASPPPVPHTPYHTPAVTPLIAPVTSVLPPELLGSVVLPNLPEKQAISLPPPALLSPVQIYGITSGQKKKNPPRDRSPKTFKGKKTTTSTPTSKVTILKKEFNDPNDALNVSLPHIPVVTTSSVIAPVIPVDWENSLKEIMSAQFKIHEKSVVEEVQRRITSEIQNNLFPDIVKTVTMTIEQSVVKKLQVSMEKTLQQHADVHTEAIMTAICGSVEQPLKEAFTESMVFTLIPAYESATREIMSQVSTSVNSVQATDKISGLSAQLDAMAKVIEALTVEVTQLRSLVKPPNTPADATPNTPLPPSPAEQMEAMRNKIATDLQSGKYESAFTKALSLSTTDMAIFCCNHANVSNVLGGEKPALSQPIMLCLMQQLGAAMALTNGLDWENAVSWLQELALTLDPSNESIARHVPSVLQQLVGNINAKMLSEPALRRRLQMLLQVIRGML